MQNKTLQKAKSNDVLKETMTKATYVLTIVKYSFLVFSN